MATTAFRKILYLQINFLYMKWSEYVSPANAHEMFLDNRVFQLNMQDKHVIVRAIFLIFFDEQNLVNQTSEWLLILPYSYSYDWILVKSLSFFNLVIICLRTLMITPETRKYWVDNTPETRKYWVDVQRGIVSSHGERDSL